MNKRIQITSVMFSTWKLCMASGSPKNMASRTEQNMDSGTRYHIAEGKSECKF